MELVKSIWWEDCKEGRFKGSFLSESAIGFSNLQITILNLKFKFPANKSKQQIQISSSE